MAETVYVSDIQKAKKFFLEGLGFTLEEDYGDNILIKSENLEIEVVQDEEKSSLFKEVEIKANDKEEAKKKLKNLGYFLMLHLRIL